MAGKEARGDSPLRTFRSKYFALALGVTAVAGACLAARYWIGSEDASAQAPTGRAPAAQRAAPQRPVTQAAAVSKAAPAPSSAAKPQHSIAAVVNGEPITRQELADECLRRYGEDVLESIVNKHLIWQACQQHKIVITEQDVDDEVAKTAAKWGFPVDRYLAMLEQERDISSDKYRRDIVWPTLALRRLATDQLEVTPDEFNKAFESEYGPKVKVRLIAVSSREKAESLLQQAKADPSKFGALAKDHSEDPTSASIRGLIPPIRRHLGDPELERVAFALKVGEVSDILSIDSQHLILYCEEHLGETPIAPQHLESAKQYIRDRVRDEKMRTVATDVFQRMQAQAEVVNVFNNAAMQKQYPGIAAVVNGRQISIRELGEECVARHGKEVIEGEINRRLLMQAMKRRSVSVTDNDIDAEISRAAESYGYLTKEGRPDVERWLKDVTEADKVSVELYVRDAVWPTVALKKLIGDEIKVSKDDLEKGFLSNYGERVEVQAIVVDNQRQANKIWEMARSTGVDEPGFGNLATQYSIEPVSRANQGRIPPIRQFGGQPLIENEAFRLKPGELSGIIAVEDKFIIMRCIGRTKPEVTKLADVQNELARDIHEKKSRIAMAEEFDRLLESAQIDNFLAGTSQAGKPSAAARPAGPELPPTTAVRPASANSAAPRGTGAPVRR